MTSGSERVRRRPAASKPGLVEYRLARNAIVREFRSGRLSRNDICDAHPELLRVARSIGAPAGEECPICDAAGLVHVTFAFGARLPAGGRCVSTASEAASLARRVSEVACYVVEVCPECAWNHLARMFLTGGCSSSANCPTAQEPTAQEPTAQEPTAQEPTAQEPSAPQSGCGKGEGKDGRGDR